MGDMIRSRFALAALFLLTAGPVFAQGSVTGGWDVTVTSPLGPLTMQVAFTQDVDRVSGVLTSQLGKLPFEGGTLSGSDLAFMFRVTILGQPVEIALTGKVDGAAIVGKAQFGGLGEGEWRAKRTAGTSTTSTTTPAPTATSSGPGAAGKWDVLLKTPGGELPATATLRDAGGTLSGTFGSQMGEVPLTGSLEGTALKLSMTVQTPQGGLNVVMTGDLDADAIVNGQAEIPGLGQLEWSATRAKH